MKYLDMAVPQYFLPTYDVTISLEVGDFEPASVSVVVQRDQPIVLQVGEHVPKQFESIFIDNLVRFAKEAVILSWAQPGSRGMAYCKISNNIV